MNKLLLPYEDVDATVREAAADQSWHNAEYDAWLDAFLSDAYEAWLDDVEPVEAEYVPFQLDGSEYADCVGNVTAEPGYLESTARTCSKLSGVGNGSPLLNSKRKDSENVKRSNDDHR